MCPACWATLLAVFSTTIATSAALIAGRDRATMVLFGGVLLLAGVHYWGAALVAWRWLALALATIVGRVVWVVVARRDELLIVAAWRRATQIASARCLMRARSADIRSSRND